MRQVTAGWIAAFALLLHVVAPLGVHASVAAAGILRPSPTVTLHLHHTHDDANRRIGLTLPDGKRESWGYDLAGRVNSLTQPGSSPATYTLSHNGAGDLTTLLAPNGGQESWSYDGAGRVTGTSWFTGTTGLFTQTVTLDAAGQRTLSSDSWGTTSYGYAAAGRLTSASYPDGSIETDQYDAGGNRTVITDTVGLTSTVISNSYDLTDQLNISSAKLNGGTAALTTYAYDGNGQQVGSAGPNGTVTNTYNDLGQLTNVVGPTTNVSYVYDGQGDRLRSYEQDGPTPVLHNDVQDLAAGMSDLVSDGTADYTYLTPGSGQAPVSAYTQSTTRSTYLATDLLGSVRLATDPTGAVIGAGAYDAWGVYRPYSGSSGATQLAGLQASSPFGYAGQYYDSGPGTYSLRARQYDPTQGRFLSQDPLSYDPQVPITTNPYEYAGDMVTQTTDPSGQGWTAYQGGTGNQDPAYEYSIARGLGLSYQGAPSPVGQGMTQVDVLIHPPAQDCAHGVTTYVANLIKADSAASAISPSAGQVWDMEHVQAFQAPGGPVAIAQGIRTHLIDGAAQGTADWVTGPTCNGALYSSTQCGGQITGLHLQLRPGGNFLSSFGVQGTVVPIAGGAALALITPVFNDTSKLVVAWSGGPGLILYDVLPKAPPCSFATGLGVMGCLAHYLFNRTIAEPFGTVVSDPNWLHKGIVAIGLLQIGSGALKGGLGATSTGGRMLGIISDEGAIAELGPQGSAQVIKDIAGGSAADATGLRVWDTSGAIITDPGLGRFANQLEAAHPNVIDVDIPREVYGEQLDLVTPKYVVEFKSNNASGVTAQAQARAGIVPGKSVAVFIPIMSKNMYEALKAKGIPGYSYRGVQIGFDKATRTPIVTNDLQQFLRDAF